MTPFDKAMRIANYARLMAIKAPTLRQSLAFHTIADRWLERAKEAANA